MASVLGDCHLRLPDGMGIKFKKKNCLLSINVIHTEKCAADMRLVLLITNRHRNLYLFRYSIVHVQNRVGVPTRSVKDLQF